MRPQRSAKLIDYVIVANLIAIAIALLVFQKTNLDLEFQKFWFDSNSQNWLIDKNEPIKKFLFYNLPKILLAALILLSLLLSILFYWPSKLKPVFNNGLFFKCLANILVFRSQRQKILILFLGLTLIPLLVGNIKKFTNIYCPSQLTIYGGSYPYVRIFSSYPKDFVQEKKGKCFPAGHAITGFCLVILFFIFEKKSRKIFGLMLGVVLGWILGLYQIAKGAHFLSDTVLTMLICFLVAALIVRIFIILVKDGSCK